MPKRGLSKEEIIEEATRLVEEHGFESFSLRELAARLGVKPASLYNHVEGISEITTTVALRASEMLNHTLFAAVKGKSAEEAFLEGTRAYRRFALEHPEIYQALIRMRSSDNKIMIKASFDSYEPLRAVIKGFGVRMPELLHFIRSLRAAMHGFVELTASGFMQKESVKRDDTYEVMIHSFLEILKGLPKAQGETGR